jgi:hypothetical protein
VCTIVADFFHNFGGYLSLQLLQLEDCILAWTISWLWFGLSDQVLFGVLSLGKGGIPFVWIYVLVFSSGVIIFEG